MWNFIKTSLSLLGLFVMIVIVVGLYASLVQDTNRDSQDSNLLEQSTTTDQSATSSDFIEIDTEELIPEDTIDF